MWQPSGRQWTIIWIATAAIVLAWPPDRGRSLGVKALNWIVDPAGTLPAFPPPLPMALDDDGDVVAAHDALESEYYRRRASSAATAWRMKLKEATDPGDPQTERQLLVAVGVVGALAVWRMEGSRRER